eukprot:UN2195
MAGSDLEADTMHGPAALALAGRPTAAARSSSPADIFRPSRRRPACTRSVCQTLQIRALRDGGQLRGVVQASRRCRRTTVFRCLAGSPGFPGGLMDALLIGCLQGLLLSAALLTHMPPLYRMVAKRQLS